MKHKKLVRYFLGVSISLILTLPILNLIVAYKEGKLGSQSFSRKTLFSTDHFEALMNYIAYRGVGLSLDTSRVIIGKDGFFFLGNSFAGIIDKAEGSLSYPDEVVERWTDKLKQLQDWYESQGVEFVMVIAPNKHTVYYEKLPDSIRYKENGTITDVIVENARKKNIHILNLKTVLRDKKKENELYFHTDTHWNNYGAMIGYKETIKYLNTIFSKAYKIVDYNVTERVSTGGGDLARLLKIKDMISDNKEKDFHFSFPNHRQICYGEIGTDNRLKPCTAGDKQKFNQYMVNQGAINKEKLLYLCDSFGLENSQFYQESFHTLWRFHLTYMNRNVLVDFVKKYKPDIVIYQIVERDVGNNSIIDDLPNIMD